MRGGTRSSGADADERGADERESEGVGESEERARRAREEAQQKQKQSQAAQESSSEERGNICPCLIFSCEGGRIRRVSRCTKRFTGNLMAVPAYNQQRAQEWEQHFSQAN